MVEDGIDTRYVYASRAPRSDPRAAAVSPQSPLAGGTLSPSVGPVRGRTTYGGPIQGEDAGGEGGQAGVNERRRWRRDKEKKEWWKVRIVQCRSTKRENGEDYGGKKEERGR